MKNTTTTKISMVLFLCFIIINISNAQVGINTTDPNPTVILDISSTDKGILIPRLETDVRSAYVPVNGDGTLVYDTGHNMFFVYNDIGGWRPVNPWKNNMDGSVTLLNAGESIGGQVQNANINGTMTANAFAGNGTIPVGGIIMWSGTINEISGLGNGEWALCDGSGVTPDLSGRFIVGYGNNTETDYQVMEAIGGQDNPNITENELPKHQHHFSGRTRESIADNATTRVYTSDREVRERNTGDILLFPWNYTLHNLRHMHSFEGDTDPNITTSEPFDNRPQYYVLAFIMRTE